MAAAPPPMPPGSMTVPPWFGWETVAIVVTVLLVAGVVFLVIGAARAGAGGRDEWRALLEGRSAGSRGRYVLDDGLPGSRRPGAAPSR